MFSLNPCRSIIALVLLLAGTMVTGVTHAELRALIKFDSGEHRLHRLVKIESNPLQTALQAAMNTPALQPGKVIIVWKGADGAVLHSESIEDPRLTHAPLIGDDAVPATIGLSDGAYMVTGPEQSAFLEVRLPANTALALMAQTWQFELKQ